MQAGDDKLRRLLDGEIDLAEIADNPVLASLAEKIYEVDITDMKIEAETPAIENSALLGFELHESGSPDAKSIDLPQLPLPELPLPAPDNDVKVPKVMRLGSISAMIFGPLISIITAANIYGQLSFLKVCSTIEDNGGFCDSTRERINWLAPTRLGYSDGWLDTGTFGIPTIGLIVLGVLMLIFGFQGWRFVRSQ